MLGGMDEGDEFEIDSIFKDDQCILREPICVTASWRNAVRNVSIGLTGQTPEGGRMKWMSPSLSCVSIEPCSTWGNRS